jgi:hypothetical protein
MNCHDGALATGFPQAAHLARIATVASAIFGAKTSHDLLWPGAAR